METPWTYSATDCCAEPGLCCEATFCPCITYSKVIALEDDPKLDSYNCCNCDCITFSLLGYLYLAPFLVLANRSNLRKRYHISGNGCSDCLCSFFWGSCVLVQEVREVKTRNEMAHDTTTGTNTGGYQLQQQGMAYGQSKSQPGQESGSMHTNGTVDQVGVRQSV